MTSSFTPRRFVNNSFVGSEADVQAVRNKHAQQSQQSNNNGAMNPDYVDTHMKYGVNNFITEHKYAIFAAGCVLVAIAIIWYFKDQIVNKLSTRLSKESKVKLFKSLYSELMPDKEKKPAATATPRKHKSATSTNSEATSDTSENPNMRDLESGIAAAETPAKHMPPVPQSHQSQQLPQQSESKILPPKQNIAATSSPPKPNPPAQQSIVTPPKQTEATSASMTSLIALPIAAPNIQQIPIAIAQKTTEDTLNDNAASGADDDLDMVKMLKKQNGGYTSVMIETDCDDSGFTNVEVQQIMQTAS
jgi:hypothetical protein